MIDLIDVNSYRIDQTCQGNFPHGRKSFAQSGWTVDCCANHSIVLSSPSNRLHWTRFTWNWTFYIWWIASKAERVQQHTINISHTHTQNWPTEEKKTVNFGLVKHTNVTILTLTTSRFREVIRPSKQTYMQRESSMWMHLLKEWLKKHAKQIDSQITLIR